MRKLSGRRGKRNLKLRKGLRRRERSGVIVAERIKVETGVLLVGLEELVETGKRRKGGGVSWRDGRRIRRTNGYQGERWI